MKKINKIADYFDVKYLQKKAEEGYGDFDAALTRLKTQLGAIGVGVRESIESDIGSPSPAKVVFNMVYKETPLSHTFDEAKEIASEEIQIFKKAVPEVEVEYVFKAPQEMPMSR